jgi:hypothetical protein
MIRRSGYPSRVVASTTNAGLTSFSVASTSRNRAGRRLTIHPVHILLELIMRTPRARVARSAIRESNDAPRNRHLDRRVGFAAPGRTSPAAPVRTSPAAPGIVRNVCYIS